jgi:tetratricopeptide (TPR) repeat protein
VLFNDLGDRVDAARIINSLGSISFAEREYPEAKQYYEHARTIAHEQESHQVKERALRGLGDVARAMRQFSDAECYYDEAATIARHLDISSERCAVLHRQGELLDMQGRHKEALTAWVEALFQDRRADHPERREHEARVARFVEEYNLDETYVELRQQYGLS